MKRGEIWSVAGGGDYTNKPRPVVIVQDDQFSETDSITVCGCTSDPTDMPLFRVAIEPSELNGLNLTTRVMADKITSVRRSRLRARIGELSPEEMIAVNRAVLVFLGFAGHTRVRPGDERNARS